MNDLETVENNRLDPTFGDGGKVIYSLPDSAFHSGSILLPDGKTLTVGRNGKQLLLVRHLSDGTFDSAFGTKHITPSPGNNFKSAGIILQPDGKILLHGSYEQEPSSPFPYAYLIRIEANGDTDDSFGKNGIVVFNNAVVSETGGDVGILPDGKILFVTRHLSGFDVVEARIYRLNKNGDIDSGFGSNGFVSAEHAYFSRIIVLAFGRLLVCGSRGRHTIFARYLEDGKLDEHFGTKGFATIPLPNVFEFSQLSAMVVQADGKIVAAGDGTTPLKTVPLVTRLQPNGDIDTSFNNGEPIVTGFDSYRAQHYALAIQSDNKIIAAGSSLGNANTSNFTLMRFLPNGELDPSFGTKGKIITDFGGFEITTHVYALSDGKTLLLGNFVSSSGQYMKAMVRYLA